MEAMCGAIGEVAQICVMYPLETIKVRRSCSRSIMSFVLRALRKPAAACLTRPALLHSGLQQPCVGTRVHKEVMSQIVVNTSTLCQDRRLPLVYLHHPKYDCILSF